MQAQVTLTKANIHASQRAMPLFSPCWAVQLLNGCKQTLTSHEYPGLPLPLSAPLLCSAFLTLNRLAALKITPAGCAQLILESSTLKPHKKSSPHGLEQD